MPNGRGSGSLKNRELYEELRNEGASKEKAARISNAVERDGARAVGPSGRQGRRLRGLDGPAPAGARQGARTVGLLAASASRELITMLREH